MICDLASSRGTCTLPYLARTHTPEARSPLNTSAAPTRRRKEQTSNAVGLDHTLTSLSLPFHHLSARPHVTSSDFIFPVFATTLCARVVRTALVVIRSHLPRAARVCSLAVTFKSGRLWLWLSDAILHIRCLRFQSQCGVTALFSEAAYISFHFCTFAETPTQHTTPRFLSTTQHDASAPRGYRPHS